MHITHIFRALQHPVRWLCSSKLPLSLVLHVDPLPRCVRLHWKVEWRLFLFDYCSQIALDKFNSLNESMSFICVHMDCSFPPSPKLKKKTWKEYVVITFHTISMTTTYRVPSLQFEDAQNYFLFVLFALYFSYTRSQSFLLSLILSLLRLALSLSLSLSPPCLVKIAECSLWKPKPLPITDRISKSVVTQKGLLARRQLLQIQAFIWDTQLFACCRHASQHKDTSHLKRMWPGVGRGLRLVLFVVLAVCVVN